MKKIIPLLGLAVIVVLVIVGVGQIKNENKEALTEENGGAVKNIKRQPMDTETRAEQEHITIREAAIRNFYDYPNEIGIRAVIDARTFILLGYDSGHLPGTDYPTGGGVLIFEKTSEGKFNLFWESKEYIVHGEGSYSRFQDLTNDGIAEIVVEDGPNGTGNTISFFAYTWRNNTFQLITPFKRYVGKDRTGKIAERIDTTIGGNYAYAKDIDNDKIMEIIDGYVDEKDMLHQEIYKWNGREYYLWKKTVEKYDPLKTYYR